MAPSLGEISWTLLLQVCVLVGAAARSAVAPGGSALSCPGAYNHLPRAGRVDVTALNFHWRGYDPLSGLRTEVRLTLQRPCRKGGGGALARADGASVATEGWGRSCADGASSEGNGGAPTRPQPLEGHLNDHCAGTLSGDTRKPSTLDAARLLGPLLCCLVPLCRPTLALGPPAVLTLLKPAPPTSPSCGMCPNLLGLPGLSASPVLWPELLPPTRWPPGPNYFMLAEQAAQYTLRRQRWLGGERTALWSLPLLVGGELSRPCAALVAPPLLGAEDGVTAKLRAKCPPTIKSFRRGSAAGPTGLRGDHLKEVLGTAHTDEVLANLTQVLQLLVRGQALLELAPHLAGASLHAVPKAADDVRPIAVGECLRRLASKCLCAAFKDAAREVLAPLQLGVAVPYGAEAAVHTARQWLAPYAEWCYAHHSRLLFQGAPMFSEAGVQQRDPLGPLLFAVALQPALRAAAAGAPGQRPDLAFAFLDDVCLAGSVQNVSSGLARLTAAARQVGLVLNPAKCCLTTCSDDCPVNPSLFPAGLP
ncbi:STRN3, partial [Symbiodinium pilosum]